ncbi:MAG: FAD-dependent oxidoreductase [Rhodospirillaceae bacterium]
MTAHSTFSRRTSLGLLAGTALVGTLATGASGLGSRRALAADTADVVIVGAGLAGLTAASWLESEGYSTTIVEAKDRIGGRCYTMTDLPGNPEAGGSSVGAMYARFLDFCDRLGVKRTPATSSGFGTHIHIKGTNILNSEWADHALNPFQGEARTLTPAAYRFRMIDQYKLFDDLESWWEPEIAAQDRSLRDLMLANGHSEAEIRLGLDTNPGYGHSIDDLSAVHMMHVWNFARSQFEAEAPNFWNIEGGNSSLVNAMAAAMTGAIHRNTPVAGIRTGGAGVEVVAEDGRVFTGKRAIVTLPFSALKFVAFDPVITGVQAEAIQTLPYGACFHAFVETDAPYWEDDGLPAGMWMDTTPGRMGPQTENGEAVGQYVFATGRLASYLNRLPQAQAEARLIADLVAARPAAKGKVRVRRSWSWSNDPYAGGMYAYWRPGMIAKYKEKMIQPTGGIHFAGEHTSQSTRGLEGAMESGERAAFEVMDVLG